jgi:hypothetical protein
MTENSAELVPVHMPLSGKDRADLLLARHLLETPGVAIQIANLLGSPIEHVLAKRLPKKATELIDKSANAAVTAAFKAAVLTLRKDKLGAPPRKWLHRGVAVGAGALGGFFGWMGLAAELPFTTTMILRSIADIARSEGESPHDLDTRLACIEVLAFGGTGKNDEGAESGYFATRAALAQQITAVSQHIVHRGLSESGAPVVIRLINAIANRFSIPVTEKVVFEAAPIIGAVSGASLNAIFIAHFQKVAQGHFIIRRLERAHGVIAVRQAYDSLGSDEGGLPSRKSPQ